jgi:murein DD-endopeptidase MepM/ murein hydrolase activator NlpD
MALGISWPARGTLVSGPGIRRDPATGTDSISESVEILSRMNEPVRAVADGQVRRIAALPQGGYAVVTEHADDRISVLAGLRQVDVDEGAAVKAGQPLGLVGRDLDGAPVLVFELWQDGSPIDPRPLLPARQN